MAYVVKMVLSGPIPKYVPVPSIDGIRVSGGNVIITGTNGAAGATVVSTNQFGLGGSFKCTNSLNPNWPQTLYRVRLP